jgi:hypothetical protein
MKKQYEAPVAEKIEFCYRDQVVASADCQYWNTLGYEGCNEIETDRSASV